MDSYLSSTNGWFWWFVFLLVEIVCFLYHRTITTVCSYAQKSSNEDKDCFHCLIPIAVRNSKLHEQQKGIQLVRKGVCLASLSSTSFELIYLTSCFLNIQKRLVFLGHFDTYQRKRRGIHGEKRTGLNAFQGRLRFGKFILAVLLYRILHYANFKFSFLKTKLKLSG